jgi:ubiquinone/menaquinone biosynthesis C-methylase UbiE
MADTCPWWFGYVLVNPLRRVAQRPSRILRPYVREGMLVLEPGCGMGFFTLDLMRMVGPQGRVVAIDLQEKMLSGLRRRAAHAGLERRLETRLARRDRLGIGDLVGQVDLVLAFYVVHELAEPAAFFAEVAAALKPDAAVLLVEPPLHVSRAAFEAQLALAEHAGLRVVERPRIGPNHVALLVHGTPRLLLESPP